MITLDSGGGPMAIEEKPLVPQSQYAVTGLYFFDSRAVEFAHTIRPSVRGELEITDLNRLYLEAGHLNVELMGRDLTWLDIGTPQSLLDATLYVKFVQERERLKIGCPEEIAWRLGYITSEQLLTLTRRMPGNEYGGYLQCLVETST